MSDKKSVTPASAEELLERISQLQDENLRLSQELADLRQARQGLPGYLVSTPNAQYNGATSGIVFRAGRAFIPDAHPDAERLAQVMELEFGYSVRHVDDFLADPESEPMKASMIDMLVEPQRQG